MSAASISPALSASRVPDNVERSAAQQFATHLWLAANVAEEGRRPLLATLNVTSHRRFIAFNTERPSSGNLAPIFLKVDYKHKKRFLHSWLPL